MLGLTPAREIDGIQLTYRTAGGTTFNVYETSSPARPGTPSPIRTSTTSKPRCATSRPRGWTFEVYDMPGVTWDSDIASLPGMGRAAWFKDSEGNTLCLDQEDAGT